ncbi:Conjugal transfer protein TrbG/VirB9/CagX (plasmid) [Thioalkalivibrio sp. K90mix]|uniref:TrbG/VirB9 family P-type conjugative transfer protein n=1 Tax=Thioalkalivibrio sp. (strain K90mix) TaxID=396595 RepID=UPI000195A7B5|nr:TrbG/VirB9 family P-type conjugative transfer protein [Thioalkalivibrio sp. K90mix]ADC73310.1 Conjugal transfer protein TrbG/VirB9/CagX [Thioalkalivibrio sp. K90mix]
MKGFMHSRVLNRALALSVLALVPALALSVQSATASDMSASAEPYTFPQETRLVKFRYDENRTYEILARPDAPTNIALGENEELVALAIGDTVQWITEDVPGNIFIKPVRSGIYTAGTIVTNKRSYQISLRAVPSNGQWYQRVSWEHGSDGMVREARGGGESFQTSVGAAPQEQAGGQQVGPVPGLDDRVSQASTSSSPRPSDLNFGYEVRGASGIVQSAFDDGRSLWIRMEDGLEELPAVFVQGRSTSKALANYHVDGDYIVVHQVSSRTTLRIGQDEVVIEKG